MNRKFISDKELLKFGEVNTLSEKAEALLNHQKENWNLVKQNFYALNNVKVKKYEFDNFYIQTQYNPSRIISSTANVDKHSIANRACFLCAENLPSEQKGINYKDEYILLCNPYPIFKQHLTISNHKHIPQSINESFKDLLELSYDLRDNFFVFYNSPNCGASAPDHLHFQAGQKNSTPLESYYSYLLENYSEILFSNSAIKISAAKNHFLNFINFHSNNPEEIEVGIKIIINKLKILQQTKEEPLFNIFSFYESNNWHIFLYPRKKHRPEQYFLKGDSKILVSPASVDMAGLLITPREEDFEKLSKYDIENIYSQVVLGDELFGPIKAIFANDNIN